MDFHQVLNILLLTLTLTTILLSLVSYILYKFRQVPDMVGKTKQTKKMEGTFFKRYEPASMARPVPVAETKTPYIPKTVAVFFIIIAAVIFAALFAQSYINGPGLDRTRAQDYAALQKAGLLKTLDYVPIDTKQILNEKISDSLKANFDGLLTQLRSRTFVLLSTPANATTAIPAWNAFFTEMKIPFRTQADMAGVSPKEILVLPDNETLSPESRNAVSAAMAAGTSVLATGAIGSADAGEAVASKWLSDTFGIQWARDISPLVQPTMFASGMAPFWNAPAGLLLEWLPLNSKFKAISTSGVSPLFVSNYRGVPSLEKYVRENLRLSSDASKKARAGWIQLDPTPIKDATDAETFYQKDALLHSLAWVAGIAQARVANWKDGKPVAVVMSVDSEDKFDNVDQFLDVFRKTKTPATFFVVAELFTKYPPMMKDLENDYEIASHSENHGLFENQTESLQFDRIQTSRLEIEEVSRRPVMGFRPPEEKYGAETVAATLANHLDYFYGDSRYFRFYPTEIADGKILYYSRVMFDDFNIIRRHDLGTPHEVTQVLFEEFNKAKLMGGAYLLGMHTQVFGLPNYKDALSGLLNLINDSGSAWKTNYRDLTHWYHDRDAIEAHVEVSQGRSFLNVKSTATEPMTGLVVQADDGSAQTFQPVRIEKISPGENQRMELVAAPR